MSNKISGAEFLAYWESKDHETWGASTSEVWADDVLLRLDGQEAGEWCSEDLAKVSTVEIISGDIFYKDASIPSVSMEEHFGAWRKRQTTRYLTVTYPADNPQALERIREAVALAGGTCLA